MKTFVTFNKPNGCVIDKSFRTEEEARNFAKESEKDMEEKYSYAPPIVIYRG